MNIKRIPGLLAAVTVFAAAAPGQLVITSSGPIRLSYGTLRITGTIYADSASVIRSGSFVVARIGATSRSYLATAVKSIYFSGSRGNDQFINYTNIPASIYGSWGADYLRGGSGNDRIYGGSDNDRIYGGSGADEIYGGTGEDVIYGQGGNDLIAGQQHDDWVDGGSGRDRIHGNDGQDYLRGGTGNDEMFGGADRDTMFGDAGADVLVSIGGGFDQLRGGTGDDNLWMDSTDAALDATSAETASGHVHRVVNFEAVRVPAFSYHFATPKELNGQNLLDPFPIPGHYGLKNNFRANPLFPGSGPTNWDADQGSIGDCHVIASLAALGEASPGHVRKMVADLGDGTFAVRFMKSGQEKYYRVDADLYVKTNGMPLYANLGTEDCLWVAIIEKAYAFFRKGDGAYKSIQGGKDTLYPHFDVNMTVRTVAELVTPQQVIDWDNAGSPAGSTKTKIGIATRLFLNQVHGFRQLGVPVITGAVSSISNTTPLVHGGKNNTWRRGSHVQMIKRVIFDSGNYPIGVELYNPHGEATQVTNLGRIYFCLTRAVAMPSKR